jgi:hypothetical protein
VRKKKNKRDKIKQYKRRKIKRQKVKLFPMLTMHHAMQTYGGMEV